VEGQGRTSRKAQLRKTHRGDDASRANSRVKTTTDGPEETARTRRMRTKRGTQTEGRASDEQAQE